MADEITITSSMTVNKSGVARVDVPAETMREDMTGTHFVNTVQDIGFAAHEALAVGSDLGTPGFAFFHNRDTTNFVQVGLDVAAAFVPFIKLLPGQKAGPVPLANTTFYAQADTGAVKLQFLIVER